MPGRRSGGIATLMPIKHHARAVECLPAFDDLGATAAAGIAATIGQHSLRSQNLKERSHGHSILGEANLRPGNASPYARHTAAVTIVSANSGGLQPSMSVSGDRK